MPHYRVYLMNGRGQFASAVSLDCADDEEALERVKKVMDGCHVELWRWVALFKGGNGLATDYFD